MLLDTIKTAAQEVIDEARLSLILNDACQASIVLVYTDHSSTIPIDWEKLTKDDVAVLMRGYAEQPGMIGMSLVFDGYTMVMDKEDEAKIPETLEGHPDTMDALVAFLYTPQETFMRRIIYVRKKEASEGHPGDYSWVDMGWEKSEGKFEGRFANPFTKK